MARLTDEERRELRELAAGAALRQDLRLVSDRRRRLFQRRGQADIDLLVAFLVEFNEMIDHRPKPFKKIVARDMKL